MSKADSFYLHRYDTVKPKNDSILNFFSCCSLEDDLAFQTSEANIIKQQYLKNKNYKTKISENPTNITDSQRFKQTQTTSNSNNGFRQTNIQHQKSTMKKSLHQDIRGTINPPIPTRLSYQEPFGNSQIEDMNLKGFHRLTSFETAPQFRSSNMGISNVESPQSTKIPTLAPRLSFTYTQQDQMNKASVQSPKQLFKNFQSSPRPIVRSPSNQFIQPPNMSILKISQLDDQDSASSAANLSTLFRNKQLLVSLQMNKKSSSNGSSKLQKIKRLPSHGYFNNNHHMKVRQTISIKQPQEEDDSSRESIVLVDSFLNNNRNFGLLVPIRQIDKESRISQSKHDMFQ